MKSSLNWGEAAVFFTWDQYGCPWFLMDLLVWWTPYGHLCSEAVEFAWLCAPHSKLVAESLDVLIISQNIQRNNPRERERERVLYMLNRVFELKFLSPIEVNRSWHPTSYILQKLLLWKPKKKIPSIVHFNLITIRTQGSNRITKGIEKWKQVIQQLDLVTLSSVGTLRLESIDSTEVK